MYLSFYRLNAKPFQMSTDPEFLWLGEKHKEALSTMKYAVFENKGILALTGDVGTGKTTLINALMKSLEEDKVAATIYDPSFEVLEFFNVVAGAFEMGKTFESKGRFIAHFKQFLIKAYERKQKVLLIIDEAQGINPEALEEIRLLSNLEEKHTRLLNIFFVGQNEFIDIVQEHRNRALRQRIAIRYHLDPLTLSETEAYIQHRLHVGGAENPIFNEEAIAEIYAFSDGYPRLINIICDHALLSGYVREVEQIGADVIRECREALEMVGREAGKGVPSGDKEIPEKGPEITEDVPGFAGPDAPVAAMAEEPKPRRKSVFPAFIGILFLFVVGIVFGYKYFVSEDLKISFSKFISRIPNEKRRSPNARLEDHHGPIVSPKTATPDTPGNVEGGDVDKYRYLIARSPEPTLFKEIRPKETEPSPSGEIKSKDTPTLFSPGDDQKVKSKAVGILASKEPPKQIQAPAEKTFTPPKRTKLLKATESGATRNGEPSGIIKPTKPDKVQISKERYWKTTVEEKPPVEKKSKDGLSNADEKKKQPAKKTAMRSKASMGSGAPKPSAALKTVPRETLVEQAKVPEEKKITALPSSRKVKSVSSTEKTLSPEKLKRRLEAFLSTYCRTYEKKDLDTFSTFFAPDAVETGKPFSSLLSQYRRNFKRIDAMTYRIDVQRYAIQEGTGLVRIEGIFHVRARLNGKSKWRVNQGDIAMVLIPSGKSFKVKRLDY